MSDLQDERRRKSPRPYYGIKNTDWVGFWEMLRDEDFSSQPPIFSKTCSFFETKCLIRRGKEKEGETEKKAKENMCMRA